MSALATALAAAFGTAWAEDSAIDELIKPSSSVSVGIGGWNKDRPQMGIYDGMRKDETQLLFDADIIKRDDATGTWQTLWVKNLGLDTREIRAEYLEQGKFGATVEYNRLKTEAPYTINSNIKGIGGDAQTLGTNIPNGASSGSNYQFGLDRDKLGFSLYRNLGLGLDLKAKFSSENKKGQRITSNGSSIFVADLIDWTMHKAEATLDYSWEKLRLSGGYQGSWFLNNNQSGYVIGGGASLAPGTGNVMTQPLDNQAHQGFVTGYYDFSPSTKGNFKVAYTRGTQNENLPTAGMSNAIYGKLPSLQGVVDTTLVQAGFSTKPMPKLSVVANLRYNQVKDKTPLYDYVRNTTNTANITVQNTPYSYRTTTGKLEGTYDLSHGYAAVAGLEYENKNRSVYDIYQLYVPLRSHTYETTSRVQLRKMLSETLNGSVAYLYSKRDGDAYQSSTLTGTAFVSPVNTADRDRNKLRLAFDWAPAEALGIQLTLETAKDTYGSANRTQGLQEGKANLLSLDANYRLSDDWQVTGWYSYNTNDAHFMTAVTNDAPTDNRIREQNDTGNALGFTLVGQINAKTKIGSELLLSHDKTVFNQSYVRGSATNVVAPDITAKLVRLKLFTEYAIDKSASVLVDLIHERWTSNDWQWVYQDGKPWQFGAATDGTAVLTMPKQNATFLGARYTFKFQ